MIYEAWLVLHKKKKVVMYCLASSGAYLCRQLHGPPIVVMICLEHLDTLLSMQNDVYQYHNDSRSPNSN